MIPYLLNRAMWIAIVAGLIGAVMALNTYDQDVAQAEREVYCQGVATWLVEESRGIRPEHRTGHPDYDEIAAEHCPGLWPAGYDQRQLAQQ
ncbi:hypothetical protein SAMN04487957_11098 [Halomonas shengliensis]|uniref:Uncharacterized protein n=1 Tax=Halomonas shengliensis TaxID=419597 RepID=A0A1H0LSZ1_9GAMM|nr:hypothetical protein [Halomonas shengliensis]SDO71379.1 hypothetical protein SAMN04487957_11098 [Halomonas shengliensis]